MDAKTKTFHTTVTNKKMNNSRAQKMLKWNAALFQLGNFTHHKIAGWSAGPGLWYERWYQWWKFAVRCVVPDSFGQTVNTQTGNRHWTTSMACWKWVVCHMTLTAVWLEKDEREGWNNHKTITDREWKGLEENVENKTEKGLKTVVTRKRGRQRFGKADKTIQRHSALVDRRC